MPTYSYRCSCGTSFDRILPLARFSEPQTCTCGAVASRVIVAPAIRGDYAGYTCPISGKWIEGRRAHQENLARNGCRILEPGESRAEASLDAALDSTVEELISNLSTRDKERLTAEMDAGVSAEVVRV